MNNATNFRILKTATLPAGPYVIGDPCYMINDEHWVPWLEEADFTIPCREHVLLANYRGQPAVGVSTAHGDGQYRDQYGNEYGVDAGLIGAVPTSALTAEQLECAETIVTFPQDFTCYFDEGVIHIGHIEINTEWDDYAEQDEEEYFEDEDEDF